MQNLLFLLALIGGDAGLARPDVEFKIFQFPADKIPRIDGNPDDWSLVPESYTIGMDQLRETVVGLGDKRDPANLDVRVKVGWVRGQNHLYFLYEAQDDYWDFASDDLHNDIFEVVIDGDRSGGPLIRQMHPDEQLRAKPETYFLPRRPRAEHHILRRPKERLGHGLGLAAGSGCLCQHGLSVQLRPGESGKLVLEFFVTPFDHARRTASGSDTATGRGARSSASWAILDYDDPHAEHTAAFGICHNHDVWQCVGSGRVPLDAIEQSLRGRGRIGRSSVDREQRVVAFAIGPQDHRLAMELRRRAGVSRTASVHRYAKAGDSL